MKKILIIIMLLVVFGGISFAQDCQVIPKTQAEKECLQIAKTVFNAMRNSDKATVNAYLPSDRQTGSFSFDSNFSFWSNKFGKNMSWKIYGIRTVRNDVIVEVGFTITYPDRIFKTKYNVNMRYFHDGWYLIKSTRVKD